MGQTLVLKKYNVEYFKCQNCGFIQTEEPYWLDEAYSSAIAANDIGLVHRNEVLSRITKSIILAMFNPNKTFLDFGGGYGLFVRMMRDKGLNFFRQDRYCINLFSQKFDLEDNIFNLVNKYELLTAFEVFEHLVNPLQEIENMLTYSENILFSTLCVPIPTPEFNQWWYYSLDYGQHIALYQLQTLKWIADQFGLYFYTNKTSIHLLSKRKISNSFFQICSRAKLAFLIQTLFFNRLNSKSLLKSDYKLLMGGDIK